jgi:hypothetical protein
MRVINDIQLEITQIIIKKNNLLSRRDICLFKRIIFITKILSVSEETYLVENNYVKCSALYLDDEGWIKVKDNYTDLSEMHSDWFDRSVKANEENLTNESVNPSS